MVDVELLVENACTYNIPQSQVFKDAKEIVVRLQDKNKKV